MFLALQFHRSPPLGTWLLGLLAVVAMSCGAANALTLSGHVYNDSNALVDLTVNGAGTDAGGLFANLLDETNTVVQVVAVDSGDGSYSFTGLTADTQYGVIVSANEGTVGEFAPPALLPSGWIYTGENIGSGAGNDGSADGMISILLTADEPDANFGLGQVGTLSGHLYLDVNGNGIQDGTDLDLGGVDVKVKDHYANILVVTSDFQGNWSATIPVGTANVIVDDADPEYPVGSIQTEGSAITSTSASFNATTSVGNNGYFMPSIVTGLVYVDTNGNGTHDVGEPGIANVDINITNANGDPVVVTTDGDGIWTAYVPEGVLVFSVDQTDADFIAAVPAGFTQTEGNTLAILLASTGVTTEAGNDGYFIPATVTGHLFIDTNGNHVKEPGEPNLPNEEVVVTDSNGTQQTVLTDFDGNWTASVPPGNTTAKVSTNTTHFLNNVPVGSTQTVGTDPTTVLAIANDSVFAGEDGYFVPATVIGHLYIDTNGNGTQDSGEPNLPSIDVVVTDSNNVVQTVNTNSDGNWKANVPPGQTSARVKTEDPVFIAAVTAGFVQTEGTVTSTVAAIANTSVSTGNNGYLIPAFVTGHLYIDANGNGTQDSGEPDLPNIDVLVTDSSSVIHIATTQTNGTWSIYVPQGNTTAKVVTTDPDFPEGAQRIEGSDPKTLNVIFNANNFTGDIGYYIPATVSGHLYIDRNGNGQQDLGELDLADVDVVVTASTLATQTVTTDSSGTWTAEVPPGATSAKIRTTDFDFLVAVPAGYKLSQGSDPSPITAVAGATTEAIPSGFYTPATVTGHLYVDTNGNGAQDSNEPNLASVGVVITDSNAVDHAVTTGQDGNWSVEVPPGSTSAKVTTSDPNFSAVLPEGFTQTQGNDPTVINALPGVTNNGGTDGFKVPVLYSISGQVRFDSNGNGSFADNDRPLPGFTVALYADANGNQAYDTLVDNLLETQATGPDGQYTFSGHPNGRYIVIETPPDAGVIKTNDKDGNNDRTIPVHIVDANNTLNDFLESGSPQGWFYDTETGAIVSGGSVAITTLPEGGAVVMLLDGSTGEYSWITNGVPGAYTMTVTAPVGYTVDPSRPASASPLVAQGLPGPFAIGSNINIAGAGLQDFSASANTWYETFVVQPGDPQVLCNNLPLLRNTPVSFVGWTARHPLSGQNSATGNPDGDLYTNLQEFAFNLNPSSGASTTTPFQVIVTSNGTIDAQLRRLAGVIAVNFDLEYITNLANSTANSGGWTGIQSITPVIVNNGDGTETVTYQNLAQVPALAGGQGFVRMKLTDIGTGAVARSVASGWSTKALSLGSQTYGNPFLPNCVFSGVIDSANSNTVDVTTAAGGTSVSTLFIAGKQYYVEIISGDNAGHRWEIDEATSTAGTLFIDTTSTMNTQAIVPVNLAGDSLVVREHITLKSAFPPSKFHASNSITNADRILLSTPGTGAYAVYYLFAFGSNPRWVDSSNATLADIGGTTIIDNCQGVYAQVKFAPVSLVLSGQVRQNAVACPLKAGPNFIAGPWPVDQTPLARSMTVAHGFSGAGSAQGSDKIQIWDGDDVAGKESYTGFFEFSAGNRKYWTDLGVATLANQDSLVMFKSFRASFIQSAAGKANWVMPLGWTP